MAKKKKEETDFFAELAEQTGGKLLAGIGASRYFIDTGNLALNYINSGKFYGGGWSTGIVELYGPPSSAKSLLAYTALGACQKMGGYAILFDCERAANENFAVTAGHVNENQLIVQTPHTIEEVEKKIYAMTKFIREKKGFDTPILFVWDSISVTSCEREWRETKLPDNYTKEQYKKIVGANEQPGERAKAAGKMLRKINPFLDENNASLFVINQTRATIGQLWGDPEVTAGGGKALPFYANCRVRTSGMKQIEDKVREVPIGVNLKFKNKKSRSFVPFLWTENVQLYFDKGINPLGGLLKVLEGAGRIEAKGAGNYKVLEPWADGKDVTFKSAAVRNDVPLSALLECPKLVDAETSEDIKKYVGVFADALALATSDTTAEKAMDEEDDIHSDDNELVEELGKD